MHLAERARGQVHAGGGGQGGRVDLELDLGARRVARVELHHLGGPQHDPRRQRHFLRLHRRRRAGLLVHRLAQLDGQGFLLALLVPVDVVHFQLHRHRLVGQALARHLDHGRELVVGLDLLRHAQVGDLHFDLRPFLADRHHEERDVVAAGVLLELVEGRRRAFRAAAVGEDDDALQHLLALVIDQREERVADVGVVEEGGVLLDQVVVEVEEAAEALLPVGGPLVRRLDVRAGLQPRRPHFRRQVARRRGVALAVAAFHPGVELRPRPVAVVLGKVEVVRVEAAGHAENVHRVLGFEPLEEVLLVVGEERQHLVLAGGQAVQRVGVVGDVVLLVDHAAGNVEDDQHLGAVGLLVVLAHGRQHEEEGQQREGDGAQQAEQHRPQRADAAGVAGVHRGDVEEAGRQDDRRDEPPGVPARRVAGMDRQADDPDRRQRPGEHRQKDPADGGAHVPAQEVADQDRDEHRRRDDGESDDLNGPYDHALTGEEGLPPVAAAGPEAEAQAEEEEPAAHRQPEEKPAGVARVGRRRGVALEDQPDVFREQVRPHHPKDVDQGAGGQQRQQHQAHGGVKQGAHPGRRGGLHCLCSTHTSSSFRRRPPASRVASSARRWFQ